MSKRNKLLDLCCICPRGTREGMPYFFVEKSVLVKHTMVVIMTMSDRFLTMTMTMTTKTDSWSKIFEACPVQLVPFLHHTLVCNLCHQIKSNQMEAKMMILMIKIKVTQWSSIHTYRSYVEMLTNLFQSWSASIWSTISIKYQYQYQCELQINSWHKPLTVLFF